MMPALYLIPNAISRVIYSRGPQTIKQFVDLVPVRLRLGLGRRVANRAYQVGHLRLNGEELADAA